MWKISWTCIKDLKIPKDEIAISSTGVIGRTLPVDIISEVAYKSISKLGSKAENSLAAAKAIMTTDTFPKEAAVEVTLMNGQKVKSQELQKAVAWLLQIWVQCYLSL